MRRLSSLATLACLLALGFAAVADAATTWTVKGRGWGHGIGMSQYGAQGYATEAGWNHRRILTHFYQGTQLSQAGTGTIRVLLRSAGAVSFDGAERIVGTPRLLDPSRTYVVRRAAAGQVALYRASDGRLIGRYAEPLAVDSPGDGHVRLRGRALNYVSDGLYRGALEFRHSAAGVMAVNALDLDDYVQGVVPGEMPTSWHMEALKAQSVAARSYALTADAGGVAFDQYPDTRSQVYRGLGGEVTRANQAVQATAGQVLRYQGRIIPTFFFSTSGGRTENIENVWVGATPQPYLSSVVSPYERSPRNRWTFRFTPRQLQARLSGYVRGRLRGIRVLKRGVSPRIVRAEVLGSRGRTRVSGSTLRMRLGLYDNWMYFTKITTAARTSRRTEATARGGVGASDAVRAVVASRSVRGSVEPVPAGRRIAVQRRGRDGRWRVVRRARTTARGAYRVGLRSAGIHRVVAGGVSGPAVRVR